MIYVEYIRRLPGVPLDGFHAIVDRGQSGWAADHAEDRLLFNVGRTFRLGPDPEYMAVWHTPGAGLERIEEWERVFASGAAAHFEEPFRVAARIERAGCYDALLEPIAGDDALYHAEYFEPVADPDAVRAFYEQRRAANGLTLNLLLLRIGRLGPDPRGLAVWSLPDYDGLDALARELDGVVSPVRPVDAGVYRDLGRETI